MKITKIDCHVLSDPDPDLSATSSAQDDIVVEIHTDEGLVGIGEADVNPWIAQACITAPGTHSMGQSLTQMLIGEDPLDVEGLWERLYVGSAMNGRRGAVINAIGALDMALHDLRGKYHGVPTYRLLGEAVRDRIVPYASLQPETENFDAYHESIVDWAVMAKRRGFTAAKASLTLSGPYAHRGLREPWSRATEVIADLRRAVGDDFALMIDVQYAFPDADTCLSVLKDWKEFDLYFVETPLPSDDVEGLHRVATEQDIPIATGEWLTTRFEFAPLIERGSLSVAQPDIGRVGGITEALRVADMAGRRGLRVIPHLWKTGISVAAAVHLSAVTAHCPFVEYLPRDLSESPLRKELLRQEPAMVDGTIPLPEAPGLGVELDRDALERFADAARALHNRKAGGS
ncbi:mandelate racemase/muconate lactonizing enzyme family protein [Streptomyces sp.]|uniref:mandelate racemase/muconate lactonizing enzyme family protein n=1 Tax=Streptomyces sp. TaxID=1931 RepID=UPI002F3E78F1